MDYSKALIELKAGNYLAREGWNGKNMFIYLVKGTYIHKSKLRNEAEKANKFYDSNRIDGGNETHIDIGDHIDMRADNGQIVVGWTPSQIDMSAEDWVVIGSETD